MNDTSLLTQTFLGGTLSAWALALGISAVIVLAVALLKPLAVRRLRAMAGRTTTGLDDALVAALDATHLWLVAIAALALGLGVIELAPRVDKAVRSAATVACFLQVGLWANVLLQSWLLRSARKAVAAPVTVASDASHSLSALGILARSLLWIVVLLLMLDNLGVNISALIAGLGIGGIAVALAVQNILGDLFASLSIVIDKPFSVGDFIIIDSLMGTVEHVGLKTTRLRSLDGEQIVMANGELLKGRIRNYKRMYERRAVFAFSLAPGAAPEQLKAIPAIVRKLIEVHKQTRFERAHFQKIGSESLDFESVFWITDPDYNLYMDIQQELNLSLMRELDRLGVDFSFTARPLAAEGRPRLAATRR